MVNSIEKYQVFWYNIHNIIKREVDSMKKSAALVVMAAGMGSRFQGLKQIEPVGPKGEILLDFSVFDAKRAGFDKVVFVIKKEIEKDFKEVIGQRIEKMIDVEYVYQDVNDVPAGVEIPAERSKPWGTAHAVLTAKNVIDTPFAVVNADDYYGISAYKKIYDCITKDETEICMVGFKLSNTITENGTVSRGVCEVEDGILKTITEVTKINNNCEYTEDDGATWSPLAKDTVVSMNMWGFKPSIFEEMEEGLVRFFEENKANLLKAEYFLPSVVDYKIKKGTQVEVMTTDDKWYGMTYKEDKVVVCEAIGKLVADGKYEGM